MASYLETIPRDILQYIGFLSGSSSVFEPPVGVFQLLRTSSIIYRSLNVYTSPHVYSHIYSTKFDTGAQRRRYRGRLPDSAFAAELLSRSKLLRRSHRVDLSSDGMTQDLWTALWMILENDVLNEQQLRAVNFTHFLLTLARVKLADKKTDSGTDSDILKFIIIWLLCLALSRQTVLNMSKGHQDELYGLILPYIFRDKQGISEKPQASEYSSHVMPVYTYAKRQILWVPEPSIAAINLVFVLLEANSIKIPPHLPETRAIANATQRSGPTREDYRVMASYQTTLPAAISAYGAHDPACPPITVSMEQDQSTNNDMCFGATLRSLCDTRCSETFAYIPGTVSGLWEGAFRIVGVPIGNVDSPTHHDSIFSIGIVKPIQCAIVEYLCLDFEGYSNPLDGDILDASDVCSPNAFDVKHDTEVVLNGRRYKKHNLQTSTTQKMESHAQEAQLCDVMLLGQTLEDYDQAWGGFKFSGRVMNDGRILLKRERKYTDGEQGLWIFEGQLRSESLILGHWRIAGNPSTVDQGIFSMGKSRAIVG